METNYKKLKQYFLEQLSAQEVEEIELQLISNAEFANDLETAETELLEDYLEGSLKSEEKKLFETNYLITEERKKKLEFLRTLKDYAKKTTSIIELSETPQTFFERVKSMFAPRGWALAGGLLLLLLALGISWRIFSTSQNPEVAILNQKDLSNLDEFKNLKNLSLISGNLRSGGNIAKLETKGLTDKVFLRLALAPNTPANGNYRISLQQEKNNIFTLEKVQSYKNEFAEEIRLVIPATLLKKGDYQIEVQPDNSTDTKFTYNFSVQ